MTSERRTEEAEGELRQKLDELGASHWRELCGVTIALHSWKPWIEVDGGFCEAPLHWQELSAALAAARPALDSDEAMEEAMELVKQATGARAARTREELEDLTEDRPGPEVIRSGTIGARGLASWEAPRREARGLVFYANREREGGADFIRVTIAAQSYAVTAEIIDEGWFEIAAKLEYARADR